MIKKSLISKKKKIKIIRIKKLDSKNDFKKLFKKIFLIGKRRILIETGLVFLNKLIKFNLIDDLYVFEAGKSLRKYGFNKIKLNNLRNYASKNQLKVNLKEDKLFKIKVK